MESRKANSLPNDTDGEEREDWQGEYVMLVCNEVVNKDRDLSRISKEVFPPFRLFFFCSLSLLSFCLFSLRKEDMAHCGRLLEKKQRDYSEHMLMYAPF